VLSDKTKRQVYDQYGEEGLKAGIPEAGGGGAWGTGSAARSKHTTARYVVRGRGELRCSQSVTLWPLQVSDPQAGRAAAPRASAFTTRETSLRR
jgi:hypothetical protein